MNLFQAVVLGIVQGITEWLPVSSSGHLVLFQQLFGIAQPVVFDVFLHLGSLLVVFAYFWKEIRGLIAGCAKLEREKLRLLLFIIIATIPIALVGFLLGNLIESAFTSILAVGIGLVFTSFLLFMSKYPRKKAGKIKWYNSLAIGLFQAIAILPGVSRSGSTISSGMFLGIKKEDAAKFSFLIFIPAILGAAIIEISKINAVENIGIMIAGTIVSAIVGFFSLKLLMRIIRADKFFWFGVYCLLLGVFVIVFSFA